MPQVEKQPTHSFGRAKNAISNLRFDSKMRGIHVDNKVSTVVLDENAWVLIDRAHQTAEMDGSFTVLPEHVVTVAAQSADPELDRALGLQPQDRDECVQLFTDIAKSKRDSKRSAIKLGATEKPINRFITSDAPLLHSELVLAIASANTQAIKDGTLTTAAHIVRKIIALK